MLPARREPYSPISHTCGVFRQISFDQANCRFRERRTKEQTIGVVLLILLWPRSVSEGSKYEVLIWSTPVRMTIASVTRYSTPPPTAQAKPDAQPPRR
jgi:hypothetical protein